MKAIHYLTYSDKPETEGLVFPSELLQNTYAPGLWVIDLQDFERLPDTFEFDAVDNNELQTLKMTRVNRSVFQVDTEKFGKFYFRIVNIYFRYQKYIGKSKLINANSKLLQVVSMDVQKLDRTCVDKGFFFVGRVDNNLERTNK
ncbi:MAG: hypothetical protein U0V75_10195 [Ferruginibacter sp.]